MHLSLRVSQQCARLILTFSLSLSLIFTLTRDEATPEWGAVMQHMRPFWWYTTHGHVPPLQMLSFFSFVFAAVRAVCEREQARYAGQQTLDMCALCAACNHARPHSLTLAASDDVRMGRKIQDIGRAHGSQKCGALHAA